MRILHLTMEFPPVIYGGLGTAVGGWVTAAARAGIPLPFSSLRVLSSWTLAWPTSITGMVTVELGEVLYSGLLLLATRTRDRFRFRGHAWPTCCYSEMDRS
jgi:hypothetical protein